MMFHELLDFLHVLFHPFIFCRKEEERAQLRQQMMDKALKAKRDEEVRSTAATCMLTPQEKKKDEETKKKAATVGITQSVSDRIKALEEEKKKQAEEVCVCLACCAADILA